MKHILSFCIALAIFISGTGCSCFINSTEMVTINVTPNDAYINVNGENFQGSQIIRCKCNKELCIIASKPGYYSNVLRIGKSFSWCGILDIVGACIWIFPALGFISGGAYVLDQDTVNITLIPDPTYTPPPAVTSKP